MPHGGDVAAIDAEDSQQAEAAGIALQQSVDYPSPPIFGPGEARFNAQEYGCSELHTTSMNTSPHPAIISLVDENRHRNAPLQQTIALGRQNAPRTMGEHRRLRRQAARTR